MQSLTGQAVNVCKTCLEKYPTHEAAASFRLHMGKLLYKREADWEVLETIRPLLQENIKDEVRLEAKMLGGLVYVRSEDYKRALALFAQVAEEAQDAETSANALFLKGYCALFDSDYETGRDAFRQFIEDYPNSPKVEQARMFLHRVEDLLEGR